MKKLIAITSLVAAAAMTTNAFAWDVDTNTNLPNTGNTAETSIASETGTKTLEADTIYKYTNSTPSNVSLNFALGTYDLKLVGSANTSGYSLTDVTVSEGSATNKLWLAQGTWKLWKDSDITVNTLYVQGGQLQVEACHSFNVTNLVLGNSTYEETYSGAGEALSGAALRIDQDFTISGTTTLIDNVKIAFANDTDSDKVLTISKLVGNGKNLSTSTFGTFNTATLKVNSAENFTGTIDLATKVTLDWGTGSFGGLTGSGSVKGGTTISIVNNGDDNVFSGTVGAADSAVNLNLSGTGTQTFGGASYFGNVAVSGNAGLTITGAATVTGNLSVATAGVVTTTGNGSITFSTGAKLVLDNALLAKLGEGVTLDIIIGTIKFGNETLGVDNLNDFTKDFIQYGDQFANFTKSWEYTNNKLTLTLSGVPEPSMFGLLAGLGALALVGARRRRKTK